LNRVIGHLDLDYFYAQVEEVQNPSLRGHPVLVCVFSGRSEDSGVVGTSNYVARELGIKSGMPIVLARRRLEGKDGSLIPMRHSKYEAISERIMEVAKKEVDILEQSGIEEAFFDITRGSGGDYSKAHSIATSVKEKILNSEGLTCSIGIASNKIIAKIASDFKKPNGLTIITPDQTKRFLWPLQVEKLYGVGPKTAEALKRVGIETLGQLAGANFGSLERVLGSKLAIYLRDAANGTNDDPVIAGQEPTQFSRIITLKRNTKDPGEIFGQLAPAIEDLHSKILAKNKRFRTVSLIAVLSNLQTRTRNRTLDSPTNDLEALRSQAEELLKGLARSSEKEFRRTGIRVADLSNASQTSLKEYFE